MRFAVYGAVTISLACLNICAALVERPNFYSAVVWLSQSNISLLILTNTCLLITISLTVILKNILFGQLRAVERDDLYEKVWYMITETCLAMTIFRDAYSARILAMFAFLLIIRMATWLIIGRPSMDVLNLLHPVISKAETNIFYFSYSIKQVK